MSPLNGEGDVALVDGLCGSWCGPTGTTARKTDSTTELLYSIERLVCIDLCRSLLYEFAGFSTRFLPT